jgi:heterotetrameric sarcosine oxidase delta subunit
MRLDCPHCGSRDLREFSYRGAFLKRPDPKPGEGAWDDYLHLRDNPAGPTRDLWYHEGGCGAWLVVNRNTVTHAITQVELASEAKP